MPSSFTNGLQVSTRGTLVIDGSVAPEGVHAAPPGSIYLQTTGQIYRKNSGVGNTGWVEIVSGGTTLPAPPANDGDGTTALQPDSTQPTGFIWRRIAGFFRQLSDTAVALTVRKNSATSTADLQQWQNESGVTALTKIDKDGQFFINPSGSTQSTPKKFGFSPNFASGEAVRLFFGDEGAGLQAGRDTMTQFYAWNGIVFQGGRATGAPVYQGAGGDTAGHDFQGTVPTARIIDVTSPDTQSVDLQRWVKANLGNVSINSNLQIKLLNNTLIFDGTSAPEGVVSAPPGSAYFRTNGQWYRKATGTGNTGWVEVVSGGASTGGTRLLGPINFAAANLSTVSVLASNASIYVNVGKVDYATTSINVTYRVATAAAGAATWAEVAIYKGAPGPGTATALTRVGFTDIATVVTTAGIKNTTVAVSGLAAEDNLWVAFGGQFATTQFQLRSGLADDIQSGALRYSTNTRMSTSAATITPALAAATIAVPWCVVKT